MLSLKRFVGLPVMIVLLTYGVIWNTIVEPMGDAIMEWMEVEV